MKTAVLAAIAAAALLTGCGAFERQEFYEFATQPKTAVAGQLPPGNRGSAPEPKESNGGQGLYRTAGSLAAPAEITLQGRAQTEGATGADAGTSGRASHATHEH
jgi:hypothetical protein